MSICKDLYITNAKFVEACEQALGKPVYSAMIKTGVDRIDILRQACLQVFMDNGGCHGAEWILRAALTDAMDGGLDFYVEQ